MNEIGLAQALLDSSRIVTMAKSLRFGMSWFLVCADGFWRFLRGWCMPHAKRVMSLGHNDLGQLSWPPCRASVRLADTGRWLAGTGPQRWRRAPRGIAVQYSESAELRAIGREYSCSVPLLTSH